MPKAMVTSRKSSSITIGPLNAIFISYWVGIGRIQTHTKQKFSYGVFVL
jgi:hypothetical protein